MIPALFLAHGSPMMAIENNKYTEFLNSLGKSMNPKAIVVFTAHWDSDLLTISSMEDSYNTIYDFYGFPRELYEIKYPAKGSKVLATRISELLQAHGISSKENTIRGLDHGAWTLLMHLYPEANIPVVQISVNPRLAIKEQLKIGAALKILGQKDILVLGSGNSVHNLGAVKWNDTSVDAWAKNFDDWIISKIETNDIEALDDYRKLAPNATLAVPTAEHFVPLFIAMGSGNSEKPEVIHRTYELGNLSYLCYRF